MQRKILHRGAVALVAVGGADGLRWGLVDDQGGEALPAEFDRVDIRDDGVVTFASGPETGAASPNGRIIAPLGRAVPHVGWADDLLLVERASEPPSLFTRAGNRIALNAQADESIRYQDRVVEFFTTSATTGFGILRRAKLDVVRLDKYVEMYGFRKRRALVAIPGPGSRGRAYGFVDEEGVEVIPPHFESADIAGFADGSGLARVGDGGKVGLIDLDGKIVVGPRYDYIGKFVDGFAVIGVGGHFGLINVAGHETIAPRYQSLGFWVSASEVLKGPMAGSRDVLLVAASNRLAGVVDATGAVRVPLEWDEIPSEPYLSYAYVQHTGLLWVRRGSKYGLLNRNGKVITQPVYDAVRIDHEMWDDSGFAVSIAGKWGLVNRHGRLSCPFNTTGSRVVTSRGSSLSEAAACSAPSMRTARPSSLPATIPSNRIRPDSFASADGGDSDLRARTGTRSRA